MNFLFAQKHPLSLFYLSFIELAERFSYYGVRSFILYAMIAGIDSINPGFGMTESLALRYLSIYGMMCSAFPVLGGWVADRYLGGIRCVQIACLMNSLCQILLAWSISSQSFYGLFLGFLGLSIAYGLFRPNISILITCLYPAGDLRIQNAFVIFYMSINIGGFLAPLICSFLVEGPYGWATGHILVSIVMFCSFLLISFKLWHILPVLQEHKLKENKNNWTFNLLETEKKRLLCLFLLLSFTMVGFIGMEQLFLSVTLYAKQIINRHIGNWIIPAGFFISVNPFLIIIVSPITMFLQDRYKSYLIGKDSTLISIINLGIAFFISSLGFIFMGICAYMGWNHFILFLIALLIITIGEVLWMPSSMLLIAQLSPQRVRASINGLSFLFVLGASIINGILALYFNSIGYWGIFTIIGFLQLSIGILTFIIYPSLVHWVTIDKEEKIV